MPEPWRVAEKTMAGYFARRDERWPATEAADLLRQIRVGRDHHWIDSQLVDLAGAIVVRAFFPVDDLIESHLKIAISYESLAYLDKSQGTPVYGCAYPQTREIVICERTLRYEPLFRTTAAHELGHVLMHTEVQQRCLLYTPQRPASTPEEREANAFMKAIILPDAVLELAIRYVCGIWGIDTRLAFEATNCARGRWIWRKRLFTSLINALCVSREMISITMKRRGFFSDDTAAYHKTYALDTKWHTPAPLEAIARPLRKVMRRLHGRVATIDTCGTGAVLFPDAN
jgi:hypothetical protein